ncbi:MAG: hypothetical protein GY946_11765 [bacterium]|nr:hypothetical protein [bacterium]
MTRLLHVPMCLVLAMVLALLVCACGSSGGVDAGTPGVDAPIAVLIQPRMAGGGYYYGTNERWDLRVAGAFLWPAGHVAVAAVDGTGARSAHMHVVEVGAAAPLRGEALASYRDLVIGSSQLRGMAATSYRDGLGNYDGLFVCVDGAPLGIQAFDVQGEDPDSRPSPAALITGLDGVLDPSVLPALAVVPKALESKILMAYAATGPQGYQIRVGLLERQGGGGWHFTGTAWIPPAAMGDCGGGIYQNIAAAYDATRREFGLGWFCNNSAGGFLWSTNMIRLDEFGIPRSALPFVTHIGVDAEHSGCTLSYNRRSDRYFHTFQHNAATVTPVGATGLTCSRPVDSCVDSVMGCIDRGSMFAAGVDYRVGFDFRMGGQCGGTLASICIGEAVSASLTEGATGSGCGSAGPWVLEPASLAPARAPGLNMVHAYVRCPEVSTTVVIHLWLRPSSLLADLRVSLIAANPAFAFDE